MSVDNVLMPLSSILADEPIYAFNYSPEAWQELRAQASELRFPCCDASVILKRSHIGTQFFAHARKGACVSGPESMDHLQAKDAIARAAIAAGWIAETEAKGTTPAGERWTADVMVTRGTVKLAFEVQLARQSLEETQARQERYAASGVRCLWLMRQRDIPMASKALPAFLLQKTDDGFCVAVQWDAYFSVAGQRYSLERFVTGALNRQLVWRPMEGATVPVNWRVWRRPCRVCKTWNALPTSGRVNQSIVIDVQKASKKHPALFDLLLPDAERRRNQIAKLATGGVLLWASCRNCGADLMDPREQYGVYRDLPEFSVTITKEMLDALDSPYETEVWGLVGCEPIAQPMSKLGVHAKISGRPYA